MRGCLRIPIATAAAYRGVLVNWRRCDICGLLSRCAISSFLCLLSGVGNSSVRWLVMWASLSGERRTEKTTKHITTRRQRETASIHNFIFRADRNRQKIKGRKILFSLSLFKLLLLLLLLSSCCCSTHNSSLSLVFKTREKYYFCFYF